MVAKRAVKRASARRSASAAGKSKGHKYVYYFGRGKAEGDGDDKALLGGKGAGLAEMTNLGIPVPPGFTITTEACVEFFARKSRYPDGMWEQVLANLRRLEQEIGKRFGDPANPLLVSVRSGARASMPGMMDTVLNLGLNDATVGGLAALTGNSRFAFDAYRRFLTMFGGVVMGVKRERFEAALEEKKRSEGVTLDTELNEQALKSLVVRFKEIIRKEAGQDFPDQPLDQLQMGIDAVFKSWYGERAITYRRLNRIPDTWGTAVNVVAMVFGNLGDTSGTGVAFTRDPSTGERRFFGEWLRNAQGEDVVAGIRTPEPIDTMAKKVPKAYAELQRIYKKLERHYKDMLDLEFTIQEGTLYMLQTRVGKRTAAAAVRIAVEMARERLIDTPTAILRVHPGQLDQLLHPQIDPKVKANVIAKGLPASPGAAVGRVVFSAVEAEQSASRGEKVILVRAETSPEDIGGMHAAQGILTARGGMTSHAAVVARGMGKCCVVGCGALVISEEKRQFAVGSTVIKGGDLITLNGSTGDVIHGDVPLVEPTMSKEFRTLMGWVDAVRRLKVRANADTPHDATVARDFGAEGIGLCRTEHMFFEGDRIRAVREMILSDTVDQRKRALAKLLPMQRADFVGIFSAMQGLPVTIRLLDPPLHEFLPHTEAEMAELAREMGLSPETVRARTAALHEFNPMLGHRGCRLGVTFPEIYEMQVQAIFEAACELRRTGARVLPEVMIPLVADRRELQYLRELTAKAASAAMATAGVTVSYTVGTMIELPRAAMVADQIAQEAEFFSFGTNDLTQTVYGLSRDDAGKFLPVYVEKNIFPDDPFVSIDREGVGAVMRIGVQKGRKTRPKLKVGICGEHGGEPSSVEFCHQIGLDYVSCSPYRVPIARLAAAHAVLQERKATRR
ncbi:MAG TPA: pyruvate, phosphate dikinase [Nitrospiria bacterium]|nr:pyruvate, phosphate dikinase [Nitrospiria bacterium]